MLIKFNKLFLLFFATLLFITNGWLIAEVKKNEVSIYGKVVNAITQSPIAGVTVRVDKTDKGAITRSDGSYEIRNLTNGKYAIRFSGVGLETYVDPNVFVNNVNAVELNVSLKEVTIELEGVEVKGSFFIRQSETVTSTQSFSSDEIRNAPGVQEDVLRATSLLPGVAVINPGRNDLLVRGGAAFENLFIVDNVELPNINHFGSQGSTGGPLSIINIDFVDNVTFSSGGFGAKYGDRASSITNINLRRGNKMNYAGKAVVSATQFSAQIEGPISNNASLILNARRSYLDLLFKAANFAFIPEYWDFFAKLNYDVDNSNQLTFIGIGALDNVFLNNSDNENFYKNSQIAVPDQKQYFTGFSWKHLYRSGFSNITLGRNFVNFETFQNDSLGNPIFKNYAKEGETKFLADFDFQLSKVLSLAFGNHFRYSSMLDYDILVPGFLRTDENNIPRPLEVDSSFTAVKNSTYASLTTSIGQHKLTFGSRLDYFDFTETKLYFSPRVSVVYQVNEVSAVIFSAGRYYQSPSYIWLMGDPSNKLSAFRADQAVLGYEHNPYDDIKVQLEGYYKVYNDYPARVYRPQAVLAPSGFEDIYSDIPFGLEPLTNAATGWSRGVELLIQKKWRPELPFFGILSVTWSQTKFTSIEGKERTSRFDSPLIFNLTFGYRLGSEWEFGLKYRAAIGTPTTPYLETGLLDYTKYNQGERYPIYRATDIRVDKRWDLGNFFLNTYVDIQNIFATRNITDSRWDVRTNSVRYNRTIGILPSIGIEFEF